MNDRTAQTEPLTTGQQLVSKWESLDSGWSEPADLADAIDAAIAGEREACAKIADDWERTAFGLGAQAVKAASRTIAESIRNRMV